MRLEPTKRLVCSLPSLVIGFVVHDFINRQRWWFWLPWVFLEFVCDRDESDRDERVVDGGGDGCEMVSRGGQERWSGGLISRAGKDNGFGFFRSCVEGEKEPCVS